MRPLSKFTSFASTCYNTFTYTHTSHILVLVQVKWQTIFDLPFEKLMHLRNPLNENKPIKISRDGQEVRLSPLGYSTHRGARRMLLRF